MLFEQQTSSFWILGRPMSTSHLHILGLVVFHLPSQGPDRTSDIDTMNTTALKTTILGTKPAAVHFAAAALFHSTPHLDRNKRPHWNSRCSSSSYYPKRKRKLQLKQSLLCNVNAYAEHMFQSWRSDFDDEGPPSWFKKQYGNKGSKKGRSKTQGPGFSIRRDFQFCDEDVDIENLFRAAFGGSKSHYWSFTEEIPQWKRGPSDFGTNHSSRHTWRWKTQWEDEYTSSHETSHNSQHEDEYDSSAESDNHNSSSSSDRVALGLSASGPLKLNEIKNAYRQCALKWHPDRHQGSSKAAAEENFKKCSAAYESLCSKVPAA